MSEVVTEEWTGELRRGALDGTVTGFLVRTSRLGEVTHRMEVSGHKDARPGHGYFLLGRVRPVPLEPRE